MSWRLLSAGIRGMATADTGAGGLFQNGGANQVTGMWHLEAPQKAAYPYIVFFPVSSTEIKAFDQDATEYRVQVDVYGTYGETQTATAPHDKVAAIADRVRMVFDRQTPTLASGWVSDAMQVVLGPRMVVDDTALRYSTDFLVIVTKE